MVPLSTAQISSTLSYFEHASLLPISTLLETIQTPAHHAVIERRMQHPLQVACESIHSVRDQLDEDQIRQYLDKLIKITAFLMQRSRGWFEITPLHHLVQRTIGMLEAEVLWCWDEGYSSSY